MHVPLIQKPSHLRALAYRIAVGMLALLMGVLPVHATSPKMDVLRERNSAKLNILKSILPEKLDHSDVLKDLELRLASERDYRGAIQARDERIALEREIVEIQKEIQTLSTSSTAQIAGIITLHAADASLVACTFQAQPPAIMGLSMNSAVLWELPVHAQGGYQVKISYEGPATPIKIEEEFYYLQASTGVASSKASDHELGILRLKGNSPQLRLTLPLGSQAVGAKIHSVTLIPCAL